MVMMFRRSRCVRAVRVSAGAAAMAAGAVVAVAGGAAKAQLQVTGINRTATVGFGDLTFSGATLGVQSFQQYNPTFASGPQNVLASVGVTVLPETATVSGSGSIVATLNSASGQSIGYTIRAPRVGPGELNLNWTGVTWDDPWSRFRRFERDGRHVLLVDTNLSTPGLASNAALNIAVRIPGDWTAIGTGTGQVNPVLWTTTTWNFSELLTFDGAFTTVRLSDTYRRQASTIRFSFELIGAEIPTPGACTVLVTAGGVMWTMRRRRA